MTSFLSGPRETKLNKFLNKLNVYQPNNKFTHEFSKEQIPFLKFMVCVFNRFIYAIYAVSHPALSRSKSTTEIPEPCMNFLHEVNHKGARTTSVTYFTHLGVFIVDFKQINIC